MVGRRLGGTLPREISDPFGQPGEVWLSVGALDRGTRLRWSVGPGSCPCPLQCGPGSPPHHSQRRAWAGPGLPFAEICVSPADRGLGPALVVRVFHGVDGSDSALTLSAGGRSHKPEREDVVAGTGLPSVGTAACH